MPYPREFEDFWLNQAQATTGIADIETCLDSLVPDVARLSDLFTTERSAGFGDYAEDVRLLLAYGLFFFPQTFARASLVLSEWRDFCHGPQGDPGSPFSILDLGCGLGAASFAALDTLGGPLCKRPIALAAVDRSPKSLEMLERIFGEHRRLWPESVALEAKCASLSQPDLFSESAYDLVLASFALNEVIESAGEHNLESWMLALLRRLKPGGSLILIEPAGRITSPRIERLRDWIVSSGAGKILGPCLHRKACPLLSKGIHSWCHEVRHVPAPASVNYLNRRLFRDVQNLKFSFLVVTDSGLDTPPEKDLVRLIAPMHRQKGRVVTTGCSSDGRIMALEIPTRGMSRIEVETLLGWERGDIIRFEDIELLGDGKTHRVRHPRRVDRGFGVQVSGAASQRQFAL